MSNLSSDSRAAIKFALSKAEGRSDINQLHDPIRPVVLVHAAQGMIDNGGLQYFFEADFPGNPPYSLFSISYVVRTVCPASSCRSGAGVP